MFRGTFIEVATPLECCVNWRMAPGSSTCDSCRRHTYWLVSAATTFKCRQWIFGSDIARQSSLTSALDFAGSSLDTTRIAFEADISEGLRDMKMRLRAATSGIVAYLISSRTAGGCPPSSAWMQAALPSERSRTYRCPAIRSLIARPRATARRPVRTGSPPTTGPRAEERRSGE